MKRSDVRDLIVLGILAVIATAIVWLAGSAMLNWFAPAVFWMMFNAPWVATAATIVMEFVIALAAVLLVYGIGYTIGKFIAHMFMFVWRRTRHA